MYGIEKKTKCHLYIIVLYSLITCILNIKIYSIVASLQFISAYCIFKIIC